MAIGDIQVPVTNSNYYSIDEDGGEICAECEKFSESIPFMS